MSPVDLKKSPCHSVKFKGQEPLEDKQVSLGSLSGVIMPSSMVRVMNLDQSSENLEHYCNVTTP